MRRWRQCGAAAVVIGLMLLVRVGVPAGAAGTHSQQNPGGLVVSVSPSTVAPGGTFQILGFHFPPGIDVTGQICGDNNLAGSADCVLDNTGLAGTDSLGRFTMSVGVSIPPVPCPCVAVVSSPQLSTTPSSPVTIVGAPVGPLLLPAAAGTVTQPLHVLKSELGGTGPWYSWFGGMPQRTLTLRGESQQRHVSPSVPGAYHRQAGDGPFHRLDIAAALSHFGPDGHGSCKGCASRL